MQVAETSSLVSELSKIAAEERALMEQSRELLSAAAAMHVSTTINSFLGLFYFTSFFNLYLIASNK